MWCVELIEVTHLCVFCFFQANNEIIFEYVIVTAKKVKIIGIRYFSKVPIVFDTLCEPLITEAPPEKKIK